LRSEIREGLQKEKKGHTARGGVGHKVGLHAKEGMSGKWYEKSEIEEE